MRRTGLLALPLSVLLASACGADPGAERRAQVAAITEAANAGDAAALRQRAGQLVELVSAQADDRQLGADEAQRLIARAEAVREHADLIDAQLIEQRRRAQQAAAERQRLEAERQRLEAERQRLEAERRRAQEQADQKGEQDGKGKGGKDGDKDGKDD